MVLKKLRAAKVYLSRFFLLSVAINDGECIRLLPERQSHALTISRFQSKILSGNLSFGPAANRG